jgi:hypothetical protein
LLADDDDDVMMKGVDCFPAASDFEIDFTTDCC